MYGELATDNYRISCVRCSLCTDSGKLILKMYAGHSMTYCRPVAVVGDDLTWTGFGLFFLTMANAYLDLDDS